MAANRADGLLRTLTVEGFGLIDKTTVELGPGLNAFTGETGSGKSMVIDALTFAFGGRAAADMVRAGHARAVVFAEVEPNAAAQAWLRENGFDGDGDELVVIAREVQATGRSSARINGKPAPASQLRELGDVLLEVVGQHEHTKLAAAGSHLDLLDAFGGSQTLRLRSAVGSHYARARDARAKLEAMHASESQAARAHEDARYAHEEITNARLSAGELETLRERRLLLGNAARIAEGLRSASSSLDDGDGGAAALLGRAMTALERIAPYGPSLRAMADEARALQSSAQELSLTIASHADEVSAQPAELEAVEERLALMETLCKKYGDSIEAVLATGEHFAAEIEAFERRDADIAAGEKELLEAESALRRDADALTAARKKAAAELSRRVDEELRALGMRGAAFRCAVDARADGVGAAGADRVEFYAALNPREPEKPVAKAASGGELSRLLLALKVALADVDPHPIVVLDEVDAGIGGAAARAVGARIASLAKSVQILCVTHLAQIAAFADRHVALEKKTSNGRSVIAARVLEEPEAMRKEIARMLSGDTSGAAALKHAETLLREVKAG